MKFVYLVSLILICSPTLLGYPFSSSEFIVYPGLLFSIFLPYYLKRSITRSALLMVLFATLICFVRMVPLQSSVYYLLGIFILFSKFDVPKDLLHFLVKGLSIFLLVTVCLDLFDPKVLDNLIYFERRSIVDNRMFFDVIRPVGFFRENSGLGLTLVLLLAIDLNYGLKIFPIILLTGLLSLSSTFILFSFLIILVHNIAIFKKPLYLVPVLVVSYLIIFPRLTVIYQVFTYDLEALMQIPLSSVKRILHPFLGFFEVIEFHSIYDFLIGLGPGNYKGFLIDHFSWLNGSDLRAGFILNIVLNLFLSFGFFYFLLLVYLLKKWRTWKLFLTVIIILFQGIPLLHPAIFLLSFLRRSNDG